MNRHALIPLMIGLVVGIAALKLGYDYVVKMKKTTGDNLGPARKIVVAGSDLSLGTKLKDKDLTVVALPVNLVPEGAVTDVKELVGQTLKMSLCAKMPVLKTMIGPGQGLEGIIPPGFRAVAVKVDEFTSVGGLLRPGTKVDILATLNVRNANGGSETVSKLVLQNIEVRAVGQQYKSETGMTESAQEKLSRSVTLLVKSDQAEVLQLAASMGTIRLALRNATDDKSTVTKGVTLTQLVPQVGSTVETEGTGTFSNLLAMAAPKAAPSPRDLTEPFEVEVIQGDRSERIYFASADSDKRVTPKRNDPAPEAAEDTDTRRLDPSALQAVGK